MTRMLLLKDMTDRVGRRYSQMEVMHCLESKTVMGELDQNSPDVFRIALDRVSHQFSDFVVEDGSLYGTIKILDTPMGRILKTLPNHGVELVTSMRAAGIVGTDNVVTQLNIVAFDMIRP